MTDKMILQKSAVIGVDEQRPHPMYGYSVHTADRASGEDNFYITPVTEPNAPWQLAVKRAIDIFGSFCGLLALAPLFAMVAITIKLQSKGPVFFRQMRTGKNEVPFEILKFRSMYTDLGDISGVQQTVSNDPRITPIGRLLRKTNLDELPQLWNVLVGDMSLVGPRPHVPDMQAAGRSYEDLVQGYSYRHLMRPGLTGLAQSRGLRGPTHQRWKAIRRIVSDVEYVRKFSLMLDIKIIIRTVANELRGGTGF